MNSKYEFFVIFCIGMINVLSTSNINCQFQENKAQYEKSTSRNGSKLLNCNETSFANLANNKIRMVNKNESSSEFQADIKRALHDGFKLIFDKSLLLNFATNRYTSPSCISNIKEVKEGFKNLDLWALRMIDSTARIPSGIFNGNLNQYGDFDQCLGITTKTGNIKGQYCLAHIQSNENFKNQDFHELVSLIKSHEAFKSNFNDVGHRIPRFSLINWGICIPTSCSAKDIEYSLSEFVKNFTKTMSLDAKIRVDPLMCQTNEPIQWSFSFVIVISFFMFFVLIAGMSTAYDFSLVIKKNEVIRAFSFKKNVSWLLDTKPCSDDIGAVHGIRFLNATMLLISHKSMAALFNPFVNRTFLAESLGQSWTVVGRAASLYTDPFLLISGMLTTYSILGRLEKGKNVKIIDEWMIRLIRILPPVVALLLFCTFIFPQMGSGPQWNLVVGSHSKLCKKNWWKLFLFVQNYFGFSEMCLTHTHHLGIDTELFFFSPFLIFGLWKWPNLFFSFMCFAIGLGTAGRYLTSLAHDLANYIYFGASIEQLFKTADYVYTFPPYRSSVYIMGVILGYILRKYKNICLSRKILALGWITAAICFALTLALPAPMGSRNYKYKAIDAALYSAFAPLSWCLSFSWIIFASHLGYTNFVTRILSWKGFQVTTKLSYSLYLTQFPVFFYNVGKRRHGDFYFNFFSIMIDSNEFIFVIICSVLLTLIFDAPFQNIRKILWRR